MTSLHHGTDMGADMGSVLPDWVPAPVKNYLIHTECGLPIRALARSEDCHASTILRQIRRFESRRDDPLVDAALKRLSRAIPGSQLTRTSPKETQNVTAAAAQLSQDIPSKTTLNNEASRILRRLCETGAVLAVAQDMDKAVVVRDGVDGVTNRTAVVDQPIAQAMALQDWIASDDPGARIARYRITSTGRSALKTLMAEQENRALGYGDDTDPSGKVRGSMVDAGEPNRMRAPMAESPLIGLARRRDKDGQPFLNRDLVAAGERLREDYELAQIGGENPQDWTELLVGGAPVEGDGRSEGNHSAAARDRVAAALSDLGPGLGDVALHCCCFLEGMEQTEKRMGWSARSGKIVLRIALQRLRRHYEEQGKFAPRIG